MARTVSFLKGHVESVSPVAKISFLFEKNCDNLLKTSRLQERCWRDLTGAYTNFW